LLYPVLVTSDKMSSEGKMRLEQAILSSVIANDLGQLPSPKCVPHQYEDIEEFDIIRVLTLLPSYSLSSAIHIRLSPVRLRDEPVYEAVSYTWATANGDASRSSTVFCSGGQIKVTRNCEDFLRRLRQPDCERVLWVDAICINQEDIEEQSQQVLSWDPSTNKRPESPSGWDMRPKRLTPNVGSPSRLCFSTIWLPWRQRYGNPDRKNNTNRLHPCMKTSHAKQPSTSPTESSVP
jgi:hypothetical protein